MPTVRDGLALRGRANVLRFCTANGLPAPAMPVDPPLKFFRWGNCGLYDRGRLFVQPARCANPGHGGMAWSWPGYIIDRTPYGVYAHECGHYVEQLLGYPARGVRKASGEQRLTSYAPNDSEWFAEMMRLFITNPSLLRMVRPATYRELARLGLQRGEPRAWQAVLQGAPARTVAMARRRIQEARG